MLVASSLTRDPRVSAACSVRGNLGPCDVVIQGTPGSDWLKDRWQAASDMGGTAIKGRHWIELDLGRSVAARRVLIDCWPPRPHRARAVVLISRARRGGGLRQGLRGRGEAARRGPLALAVRRRRGGGRAPTDLRRGWRREPRRQKPGGDAPPQGRDHRAAATVSPLPPRHPEARARMGRLGLADRHRRRRTPRRLRSARNKPAVAITLARRLAGLEQCICSSRRNLTPWVFLWRIIFREPEGELFECPHIQNCVRPPR